MIQVEYLNDGTLVRHYSDEGYVLLQNETGEKYGEAVDCVPCRYTYTETNEKSEESGDQITGDEFLAMVEEVL